MQKPLVLLHRAGHNKKYVHPPNTIKRARETLASVQVNGYEIDVRQTKDGVLVTSHDKVRHQTYQQFKKNKKGNTLASWVDWAGKHPEKTLYLDLKEPVPSHALFQLIEPIRNRCLIGSFWPRVIAGVATYAKENNKPIRTYFIMGTPFFAKAQIRVADYYFKKHGKPTGIHFCYDDRAPHGLRWLHLILVRSLTNEAKSRGYRVVAGASSSRNALRRMLKWDVDAVMPNHHDHIPQ